MHILVTGGAGFIGSHLVDALIERGHQIVVIDSLIEGKREYLEQAINTGNCELIIEDIRNEEFILDKLAASDMVYHMAADPDVRSSVPEPMKSYTHNMNGTMNILEYMRKHEIKKMVFASSGGTVYGDVDQFPITEKAVLRPISPYGASKAAAEMYLSAYAHSYEIKIASVRYANIFGERSTHGVGYDFFHKLRADGNQLTILGDGTQQKSYLHVSDCIAATLLVGDQLDKQKSWYEYFNVGSDYWFTVNQIADIYAKELELTDVEYQYTGGSRGWKGDVAKMLLSIEKLAALGYEERVSFEEGVHRYCEWLKKTDK